MEIPKSVIKDATELLGKDIDYSLEMLGRELYSIELRRSPQTLGSEIPPQDLRQKAEDYIERKRDVLQKAICGHWEDKTKDDFLDTSELLGLLIGLIAEALDLSFSYIVISMNIGVIIIKRGIKRFCLDRDSSKSTTN
jgi:hypothetical protein